MAQTRSLVVVLGDQLNRDASAFDGFDVKQDAVWMAEVDEESTHIWSSKQLLPSTDLALPFTVSFTMQVSLHFI